ncbi:hypothetical protein AB205_0100640 [Aquarana catesbeiana]|uniref:phosphoinositide 5-phosphatase n=1 Tax=Aquarana catesbeiana TaxID=8400 RepID=A0A2G9NB51_AQUCT|nr:hypothetical protein AB205_0100640 [Aquarana catesbeiana]
MVLLKIVVGCTLLHGMWGQHHHLEISAHYFSLIHLFQISICMSLDLAFDDPWSLFLMDILAPLGYIKLSSIRMQGLLLLTFVKHKHIPFVQDIRTNYIRTGLYGYWGNKGGVTVRMSVYGHMLCFMNCHLPAHMENTNQRLDDFERMLEAQQFDGESIGGILDHDGKKRKPAWTDRILWKLKEISESEQEESVGSEFEHILKAHLEKYTSHMSYGISDHKPVTGTFTLQVYISADEIPLDGGEFLLCYFCHNLQCLAGISDPFQIQPGRTLPGKDGSQESTDDSTKSDMFMGSGF